MSSERGWGEPSWVATEALAGVTPPNVTSHAWHCCCRPALDDESRTHSPRIKRSESMMPHDMYMEAVQAPRRPLVLVLTWDKGRESRLC